ncbi:TetR/AcrR family transcriptional repressor of nem operon [Paraburkholderia sp. GAS199]|uniref:TetR/AcrR family transcriptional regulator n=1 Tax=Paraburkholderia sp. GAS199 TaxID=3035126 RepID=UPI003D1BB427
MGHSQAEKARSRERILDAAASQISETGFGSVAVAELMQSAGLTKGAFYAHFDSREAMIAEASVRAMQRGQARLTELFAKDVQPSLADILDVWLDPMHIQNPSSGCGICTLAGEARHAGPEVQKVIAEQFNRNVEQIARALGSGPSATARATAVLTAIVGAVNMARAVGDPALARDILANARAMAMQCESPRSFRTSSM